MNVRRRGGTRAEHHRGAEVRIGWAARGHAAIAGTVLVLLVSGCASAAPAASTPAAAAAAASTSAPALVSYSSTQFRLPFRVALPAWVTASHASASESPGAVTWDQSDCSAGATPCPDGSDLKLRFLSPYTLYRPLDAPAPSPMPGYALYMAYLQSVSALHITDKVSTTVAGRPATVMTVTASATLHGDVGCEQPGYEDAGDCYGFRDDLRSRFAVVDVGGKVLIIWLRANPTGPNFAAESAEFATMLTSVQLR